MRRLVGDLSSLFLSSFVLVSKSHNRFGLVHEAELADTPWRRAGANLSDFFNFSQTEEEFKERKKAAAQLQRRFLVALETFSFARYFSWPEKFAIAGVCHEKWCPCALGSRAAEDFKHFQF